MKRYTTANMAAMMSFVLAGGCTDDSSRRADAMKNEAAVNDYRVRSTASHVVASSSRAPHSQARIPGMASYKELRDRFIAQQDLLGIPPLQRPGAVIIHPNVDPTLRYDRASRSVKGPPPDNYYLIFGGVGGPEPKRQYAFGRSNVGNIVYGEYINQPSDSRDLHIYEIVSARLGSAAPHQNIVGRTRLLRSEFDLTKIADYFNAFGRDDEASRRITKIFVDSRDEHISLWNLDNAMNEAFKTESRKRMLARIGK
ncbi:hypothetical protein [uncultured Sphingomonas sp.]|uniref:hypothetical protein n=1 Tax=uncultured Sphingomonas sp. TaxID=158754 RepID=UPI0030D89B6E